jgi:acetyltransferase-like isoleucine patch superfamily enzyme
MNKPLHKALRGIFSVFFDVRYLRGRFFEENAQGWKWALKCLLTQRLLWFNRHVPWPTGPFMLVGDPSRIEFHPDDLNNFQTFGVYFSNPNGGRIVLGRGSYLSPNVGLITTNHDLISLDRFDAPRDIVLGERCWIGMNAVILPGVVLGDRTVVAAGAVVTKSFPEGHCVIGGVPAHFLKGL